MDEPVTEAVKEGHGLLTVLGTGTGAAIVGYFGRALAALFRQWIKGEAAAVTASADAEAKATEAENDAREQDRASFKAVTDEMRRILDESKEDRRTLHGELDGVYKQVTALRAELAAVMLRLDECERDRTRLSRRLTELEGGRGGA